MIQEINLQGKKIGKGHPVYLVAEIGSNHCRDQKVVKELIDMIEGRKHRSLSCYYAFSGFLLGYDGTLYYCSHSNGIGNCLKRSAYDLFYDPDNLRYRQATLIEKECGYCPPYTRTRMEMEKDLYKIVKFVLKEKIRSKFSLGR